MRASVDKWTQVLRSKKHPPRSQKKVQIVYPAFQWAQSLSHVYLNVKYSTKFDSPGYLEVLNETVNFTNTSVALTADVDYVSELWTRPRVG